MKRNKYYKELRFLFRSFFVYKKPFLYLKNRFWYGPKLLKKKMVHGQAPNTDEFSVHFFSCHDDFLILSWSLASFFTFMPKTGQVYIHEDGSFTSQDKQIMKKLFPYVIVIDRRKSDEKVQQWLRAYPAALRFRQNADKYIFAIKLIDPYFVSSAQFRLIVDSDLIWLREDTDISGNFLQASFMMQTKNGMHYKFADGSQLNPSICPANSGIVGYQADKFDLGALEEFCRKNGENNPSRVIEQAGFAYILRPRFLDDSKYSLKHRENQIARHYTNPVREQFWLEGVEKIKESIL